MTAAAPKTRRLLVRTVGTVEPFTKRSSGGTNEFIIDVPTTAKITYAPIVAPGGSKYPEAAALRIYEGTKQTAMFRNVVEFRDLSYPIVHRVQRVDEKSSSSIDENGSESKRKVHIEDAWIEEELDF